MAPSVLYTSPWAESAEEGRRGLGNRDGVIVCTAHGSWTNGDGVLRGRVVMESEQNPSKGDRSPENEIMMIASL